MNLYDAQAKFITRRHFLRHCQMGLGSLALGTLMNRAGAANPLDRRVPQSGGKVKNLSLIHI